MNTFYQNRDVNKCTWCRDTLGQRSLFDFCIVPANLFRSVLDIRVKKGCRTVDRSINACWSTTCIWKNRWGLHKCAWPGEPAGKMGGTAGQRCRQYFCRQRIVLVPRAPGMHSGCGGGMAAVQSSCSFICCSSMRTGKDTRKDSEWWGKSNPLVEPRGERCYSSKESRLQGMASEPSRIFFAFAKTEDGNSATVTVKMSEMQSLENFGKKLDSICWQSNKVFLQTICRLRQKNVYCRRKWCLAQQWGRHGWKMERLNQRSFNPIHYYPTDTQEGHLGRKVPSLQPKSS